MGPIWNHKLSSYVYSENEKQNTYTHKTLKLYLKKTSQEIIKILSL